jgi:hypothetical protein
MKRKNYIEVEKFAKRLKERIALASDIDLQTEASKDIFESVLNFEKLVYEFMFDLLKSERICSHCDAVSAK